MPPRCPHCRNRSEYAYIDFHCPTCGLDFDQSTVARFAGMTDYARFHAIGHHHAKDCRPYGSNLPPNMTNENRRHYAQGYTSATEKSAAVRALRWEKAKADLWL